MKHKNKNKQLLNDIKQLKYSEIYISELLAVLKCYFDLNDPLIKKYQADSRYELVDKNTLIKELECIH